MSTDPLSTGPRWWRILINGAIAFACLLAGLAALLFGGTISLVGTDAPDSLRDKFVAFSTMLALGVLTLCLAYQFGRDTLAYITERRARPVSGTTRMPLALMAGCTYWMVAGFILIGGATNVPLWGSLLILAVPPLTLLAFRVPAMRRARATRLAARAAAREAARPVITTRHQRVVRRKTRAQRRA